MIKLIWKVPRGEAIYVAVTGRREIHCYRVEQGTDYKNKLSIRNRAHRIRYPPLKANRWGHVHSGGEVAHKPTLKIRGTRMLTVHKKR
jgi:hypothetical protein